MDRYEHKLKMNEMRTALEEGRVEDACLIADSINYRKEKTVSMLCLIGEVYEKAERYEESKDALICAYERSPIGRTILYRLAIVAVKAGNPDEAEEYYNEFVNIAPTDNLRYILKYQILKAKGASVAEMISVLEEYKERESSERWSYELATLYHKAGMNNKCVDLCDEIVLWYGEGKYVEKALELKMDYQPLTPEQEKKYRKIRQKERGVVEVFPGEVLRSGDIITEKREIPQVTYNP
ncbi:MAG: tetratricopeptide repeat protein, partial [Lachnospiraceae bacterium]|nr:tetratricopeptide repeat protein [Lachnospiraceae bacterium]